MKHPQRSDYMNGKVTHEEYYTSVAKAAGLDYSKSPLLPRIKRALADGDDALNSIPLTKWDALGVGSYRAVKAALKLHGDLYSLAGSTCTQKAAARIAARGEKGG